MRRVPLPMNWLAHLLLSDPDPCSRIGNLLPDMLPANELREVHPDYQNGIRHHLQIDAFTDRHPVFKRSAGRVGEPWRRYRAIIMDVYYDHILSRDWASHSAIPLDSLVADFHDSLDEHAPRLPKRAADRLLRIRDEGWLGSYRSVEGVSSALRGIGRRLRRPVPLHESLADLTTHHEDLRADFAEFFPEAVNLPKQSGASELCR